MCTERFGAKIKSVATEWGRLSPSAARPLSPSEGEDLAVLAQGLPDDWCAQLIPPHGQVSIGPYATRQRFVRCWLSARAVGCVHRERWRAV